MSQLQLTPPLLIVTMGYPGAGKTFFARQFAETYKIPHVSEERIRFELFEKPQFNDDEQDIITRILNYNLEQLMLTKVPIVCDGLFSRQKSRKALFDIAKRYGYRTLTVWVQTDASTVKHRAMRRDKRSLDNQYSFALDLADFERLCAQLQRPSEKEPSIVLSGKNAFKGQSLAVLKKITEMYANGLNTQVNNLNSAAGRRLIS